MVNKVNTSEAEVESEVAVENYQLKRVVSVHPFSSSAALYIYIQP